MKAYHLFISHSWTHSDAYDKLVALLRKRPNFEFRDYSVPKDDPIHTNGTTEQLRVAISQQMQPCGVVLILAGVYSTYSKWINREVEIAKSKKKPIIAIEPWASEKTSQYVKESANEIVGWNTNSIVSAIRKLA